MGRIDYWHTTMPFLGTPCTVQLRAEGFAVGRKLVRAYMQEMVLRDISQAQSVQQLQGSNRSIFTAKQSGFFPKSSLVYRHHLYQNVPWSYVSDRCHRLVQSQDRWTLSDTLDTAGLGGCPNAVESYGMPAFVRTGAASLPPVKNTSVSLGLHIIESMDGKSRWADNIMIERWFRSLKTELIYINEYRSPRELRMAIRDYINDYNTRRPHEALDYATPEAVYKASFAVNGVA